MDLLRQLDTATLAFVTGLAGLMLALTMSGIRIAGMRNGALGYWAGAGLAGAVGHLLGYFTLVLGLPLPKLLGLAIANVSVTLVHALLLSGVLAFAGRRPRAGVLVMVALVTGSLAFAWPDGWSVLRNRILVLGTLYLGFDLVAGTVLWRQGRQHADGFHYAAASAFFLNVAVLVVRLVHAALATTPTDSFDRGPFQTAVFVCGLVFVAQLTITLALLMFQVKEIELRRLVHRDPLTGLFNRRSLFEHAEREQARCERYGTPLALVMLDIDAFKSVNDTFGHGAGDDVICETAARVACGLRDVDAAFRLGGEEFLILLPSTDLDDAIAVAERLRVAIAARPSDAIGRTVTASFGVTELARGHEDWESAMRRADVALYRAKDEGRNRVFAMSAVAGDRRGAAAGTALDVP